jgi:hypothetical protein
VKNPNYRMYAFVANLYLSDKQFGIQAGHAKGEMIRSFVFADGTPKQMQAISEFLNDGKTWIILGAVNQRGVLDAYAVLDDMAPRLELPYALFREDEDSMNCMATACCVLIPEEMYDAKPEKDEVGNVIAYEYLSENGYFRRFPADQPHGRLIELIKSHRLA